MNEAPADDVRSYYGRGIIKEPVWTWEIPAYFFAGGLAGASALLGAAADGAGEDRLARAAWRVALAGAVASPPLLISDLGRPDRFHHMLRVAKLTSPMSVGSWVLAVFAPSAVVAAGLRELGRFPRLGRVAGGVAASLGPFMTTYTAALVANTAVPVWHEARRELPLLFGGGAVATAGAAGALATDPADGRAARRLAIAGAALEIGAAEAMERRLGELAEPYRRGRSGLAAKLAKGLAGAGAVTLAVAGRRRAGTVAGGLLVLAGSACARWAVYAAGFASARDPKYTVGMQRRPAAE